MSQPTFNKFGTKFVCGTENQLNEAKQENRIVFGNLNYENQSKINSKMWCFPINEHIRSTDWIDDKRIILALNKKIGILELDDFGSTKEVLILPNLHTDTIRQISYNSNNQLMISGGFDGN